MITKQQAIKVCRKLGFEERARKEIQFKFVHDGVVHLTTAVPKGHGDLYITDQVRKQLALSREQLSLAVKCPFKADDYLRHLVEAGIIPSGDDEEGDDGEVAEVKAIADRKRRRKRRRK